MYFNYELRFPHKGKIIHTPTDECRRRGEEIIEYCAAHVVLPSCFYHYQKGGHVVALHAHLKNEFFFKIDIKNFYYSIARHRVAKALYGTGFPYARDFTRWSVVKNPYQPGPTYSLPIGFVQSPLLASLVLMDSAVMKMIRVAEAAGATISVYLDDLIVSAANQKMLEAMFVDFLKAFEEANLPPNNKKVTSPVTEIVAFNCDLKHGSATVRPDRVAEFFNGKILSAAAISSFVAYCNKVKSANFVP